MSLPVERVLVARSANGTVMLAPSLAVSPSVLEELNHQTSEVTSEHGERRGFILNYILMHILQ